MTKFPPRFFLDSPVGPVVTCHVCIHIDRRCATLLCQPSMSINLETHASPFSWVAYIALLPPQPLEPVSELPSRACLQPCGWLPSTTPLFGTKERGDSCSLACECTLTVKAIGTEASFEFRCVHYFNLCMSGRQMCEQVWLQKGIA